MSSGSENGFGPFFLGLAFVVVCMIQAGFNGLLLVPAACGALYFIVVFMNGLESNTRARKKPSDK